MPLSKITVRQRLERQFLVDVNNPAKGSVDLCFYWSGRAAPEDAIRAEYQALIDMLLDPEQVPRH